MQSTLVINKCGERFFNGYYKHVGMAVENFRLKQVN
jgi:hypothetical protein